MKGILYREKNGEWFVINFQATLNGPFPQTLPVLKDTFDINNKQIIIELKEGKEVEFEVYNEKYAKLVNCL